MATLMFVRKVYLTQNAFTSSRITVVEIVNGCQLCQKDSAYPLCMLEMNDELLNQSVEETLFSTEEPMMDVCEEETCRSKTLVDEKPYIFQIGFNRAGCTSLRKFFRRNGINACQFGSGSFGRTMYKNFKENRLLMDGIYRHECTYFGDMETVPVVYGYLKYYKILDQQYPNSRFILNTREKSSWLRSREYHAKGFYINVTSSYHGLDHDGIKKVWSDAYDHHYREVKKYFEGRPEKLVVFDILEDDIRKQTGGFFQRS